MHFTTILTAAAILPFSLAAPLEQRACTGPAVNTATLDLIKEFEGFRASPYSDPTGNPTVGYGHLCSNSACSDVSYSFPLTETTGTQLLASDVKTAQNAVTLATASCVVLNANQYGALVSWTFNVGASNLKSSSLLSRLNTCSEKVNTVIAQELPKWNKSGGQTLPGLTRRRAAEVDLAQTATSVKALPACG